MKLLQTMLQETSVDKIEGKKRNRLEIAIKKLFVQEVVKKMMNSEFYIFFIFNSPMDGKLTKWNE